MNSADYNYCCRCIYLSRSGQATCDYIVLTGHMRGCPAGVGCDRRVNGEFQWMVMAAFGWSDSPVWKKRDVDGAFMITKKEVQP